MAKKEKNIKKNKFEDLILNQLNMILRRDLNDSRLQFASLTKVELSPDYSIAKVYWDTFDPEKKAGIKEALEVATPKMRQALSQNIKVRHTPALELHYDTQFESEQYITNLLEEESDPSEE